MFILPVGNQEMLAKKHNFKKTGNYNFNFWSWIYCLMFLIVLRRTKSKQTLFGHYGGYWNVTDIFLNIDCSVEIACRSEKVLFTIDAAVINGIAFRGTKLFFSKLTIMVKRNVKHVIWNLIIFRGLEINEIKIEWNKFILSVKG